MKYLLALTTLLLSACTDLRQNFYLLKEVPAAYVKKHSIPFDAADMFSLQIKEELVIQGITEEREYSDIPFRRYTQVSSTENRLDKADKRKIDEETYLYLEGISAGKNKGVSLYLITMPLLKRSFTEKYFNDSSKLHLKPVWSIYVGQWVRTAKGIKVCFTVDETDLVYKATFSGKAVVLDEISYTGLEGREGYGNSGEEPLMISIRDILDTGSDSGLVFNQIDKNRDVVISREIKDSIQAYRVRDFVIYKKTHKCKRKRKDKCRHKEPYRLMVTTKEVRGEFLFATKRYKGTLTPKKLVVSDELLGSWE